jgi:hypothetical protein
MTRCLHGPNTLLALSSDSFSRTNFNGNFLTACCVKSANDVTGRARLTTFTQLRYFTRQILLAF